MPMPMMELKMPKKIALDKLPANVRDLLGTSLLEGLPVKYVVYVGKQYGLEGVIKGNGISCSCSVCKGCKSRLASLNSLVTGWLVKFSGQLLTDVEASGCEDKRNRKAREGVKVGKGRDPYAQHREVSPITHIHQHSSFATVTYLQSISGFLRCNSWIYLDALAHYLNLVIGISNVLLKAKSLF